MTPAFRHSRGAVDVAEEGVQRLDALLEPALQPLPFRLGDDAGDDVEGDQPLGGLRVAIDGEGDADAPEEQFGLAAPERDMVGRDGVEPALQLDIGLANFLGTARHLVEGQSHPTPLASQDMHGRDTTVQDGTRKRRASDTRRKGDDVPRPLPTQQANARPVCARRGIFGGRN